MSRTTDIYSTECSTDLMMYESDPKEKFRYLEVRNADGEYIESLCLDKDDLKDIITNLKKYLKQWKKHNY